jgi:uncharacterized protein (TIGR02594 family)
MIKHTHEPSLADRLTRRSRYMNITPDAAAVIRDADPKWLKNAANDLGIIEQEGPCDSDRILQYHAATTLRATSDEVPWCASAMCFWLERAGITSPKSAQARSFLQWGVPLKRPRRGCIVVLTRPGGPSWGGHVGVWLGSTWRLSSNNVRRGYEIVLGGNQGDAVNIRLFPSSRVLGWRWPKRPSNSRTIMASAAIATTQAATLVASGAASSTSPAAPVPPASGEAVSALVSAAVAAAPGVLGEWLRAAAPAVNYGALFIIVYDRLRRMWTRGL